MASIFSKIIAGEIPSCKIAEDEQFFAFLDINPMAKGHTLVVPKKETDYLFDIDDASLSAMALFAKKVAKGIQAAIPCQRVGLMVIGLEVPHAHNPSDSYPKRKRYEPLESSIETFSNRIRRNCASDTTQVVDFSNPFSTKEQSQRGSTSK